MSGKYTLFIDMDGVLAYWEDYNIPRVIFEDHNFFRDLEPCKNIIKAIQIIKEKYNEEIDMEICSAILSEPVVPVKNEWLDAHLPEIPIDKRFFPMVGTSKTAMIKGRNPKKCFLLDDFTKNLIEWRNAGAIGIKFLNGANGQIGRWDGDFVVGRTQPEILAETIYAIIKKPWETM